MRNVAFLLALGLAGCGSKYIPLPEVKDSDPVMQLNTDRWQAMVNDLTTPPGDGIAHPLAVPVPVKGQPL